jgi:hypothetical protein
VCARARVGVRARARARAACSAHASLSSMACPALRYFVSTLSHKWHNFGGKKVLNTKSVFQCSLQRLSETFLILRRKSKI